MYGRCLELKWLEVVQQLICKYKNESINNNYLIITKIIFRYVIID